MSHSFFSLTPDAVLAAVEQAGHATTGLCYPLNSLENRVYEVELDDDARTRRIAKFYRPGRWSRAQIEEEHALLAALDEAEVPVCAPLRFPDGATLHEAAGGILFTLFPRTGGRAPDDLDDATLTELGRLIARVHNVAGAMPLAHRPALSPATYGRAALATLTAPGGPAMAPGVGARYLTVAERICTVAEARWQGLRTQTIHADWHRGNLLRGSRGWVVLDFDDMATGPAVQDLWLILPARVAECPREVAALLKGYQQLRDFDDRELRLIEALRALRYLRYAAWIAARWTDPAFQRAFPHFATDAYWEGQTADLADQLRALDS